MVGDKELEKMEKDWMRNVKFYRLIEEYERLVDRNYPKRGR